MKIKKKNRGSNYNSTTRSRAYLEWWYDNTDKEVNILVLRPPSRTDYHINSFSPRILKERNSWFDGIETKLTQDSFKKTSANALQRFNKYIFISS